MAWRSETADLVCTDVRVYECSFCLSEPGSGSDAFALKTKSVPTTTPNPKIS